MGVYRTYFDKSNTLIKDSAINTARNEIIQLYYGNGYTRHIFKINLDSSTELYKLTQVDASKRIINSVTHKLKFKNTSSYALNPKYENYQHLQFEDMFRATSFALELHLVPEDWTEGDGYGYVKPLNPYPEDKIYVEDFSNWTNRTQSNAWSVSGAVSSASTAIAIASLDRGNEDIEFDVTDIINSMLTGGTNYGFCLKYPYDLESLNLGKKYYVGFFSKNTNTFYEPYLETTFDDIVIDNRSNFIQNKDNTLYFYSNIDGSLRNLDSTPTSVTINSMGTFGVTQVSEGVYKATIPASATTGLDTDVIYYDVWSGITYNGVEYGPITKEFVLKPQDNYFNFGEDRLYSSNYALKPAGINFGEELSKGEIRKVKILISTIENQINTPLDDLEYKLYTLQGQNHVNIIDWTKVNIGASYNYILLDTNWLIPQVYYIDFKVTKNNEVKYHNNKIKFYVVNRYGA